MLDLCHFNLVLLLYSDGIGNWSIDGCTTVVDSNDLSSVTCSCDHLTNFAMLVVSLH